MVMLTALGCSADAVGSLHSMSDPSRTFAGIPSGPIAAVVGDELVRQPTLAERNLLNEITMALRASGFAAREFESAGEADTLLFCTEEVREVEFDTYRTIPTTYQSYGTRRRGGRDDSYSETTYGQEVIPVTKRWLEVTLTMRAVERMSYEARPTDLPLDVLTFWSGTAVVEASEYNNRRPEILLELIGMWGTTQSMPLMPADISPG
jgi:hypothetical protein